MTQQDVSTSKEDDVKKVKGKYGRNQDQSAPAKKPRHSEIKGKNWPCGYCKLSFNVWNELYAHVMNVHPLWKCEYCEETYSSKAELRKHMKNEHKQKKVLIQYECMHCRGTEDTFDAAVYHAQIHLVQTKDNGTQYELFFDNHKKSVRNNLLITIRFDYKTLLKDAWFEMFPKLSPPLRIKASHLYKYTRCVKLNWDSRSRNEEKERCVLLYQCGACKMIFYPTMVQKHCDFNGACVYWRNKGHKCLECQISFFTLTALRHHDKRHVNNQLRMVKIATFNTKDDVHFNNILKQISRSSVDDTDEDTEVEEISRNPETPENAVSDRIENDYNGAVTVWETDDSNDSNEIIQKNSDDNINSVKNINHDSVAKEGIINRNDQNNHSALKRRRISSEDNNPGRMLEVDHKSQSKKGQRTLEDDVESVYSRYNSEENENVDQPNQAVQEDTGTTTNKGAVNSVESEMESSEYVSLNDNMAILHGSFHQEDIRFESSRGKQCTAIAAVACAAFDVVDPNAWTKCIIDKIVIIGDKYYNQCIASRKLPAAGEVNPDYLAVTDLMKTIIVDESIVPIEFEEKTNLNGHIDNDDSPGFPNLRNGLEMLFRSHACGILTSNAMSVAVYYQAAGETYWLFDSHSRGPEGEPAVGGAACCMRFSHLDDLHDLLRRNFFVSASEALKGRDLINSLNVYSLTPLRVRTGN